MYISGCEWCTVCAKEIDLFWVKVRVTAERVGLAVAL